MDGGLLTSPPPRFMAQRFGSFQPRGIRPEGTYTFNFRAPSMPGQGASQSCDGKKPRTKVVTRKTVDYNTTVCGYVQNRVWQRDFRDVRSVQPDSLYFPHLKPPVDMLEHPMNCVVTKHVRTASNKVRCPVFCVCWTPEGRRLITGASSGEFTLWNGLTFSFETILQAHDTSVRSMIWSHNEQWLLSGDHGGYVKYWQLNMNNVKMYQAHKDPVRGLRFVSMVTTAGRIRCQALFCLWILLCSLLWLMWTTVVIRLILNILGAHLTGILAVGSSVVNNKAKKKEIDVVYSTLHST